MIFADRSGSTSRHLAYGRTPFIPQRLANGPGHFRHQNGFHDDGPDTDGPGPFYQPTSAVSGAQDDGDVGSDPYEFRCQYFAFCHFHCFP